MTKEEFLKSCRYINEDTMMYAIGMAYEAGAWAQKDAFKAMLQKHTPLVAVGGDEQFTQGFNAALTEIMESYELL